MTNLVPIQCDPSIKVECSKAINKALKKKSWVQLLPQQGKKNLLVPENLLPKGEGIIIQSGGSAGGPNLCLHSIENLNQSAIATGKWLEKLHFKTQECIVLNSLPMHHISGFMPWWRSIIWKNRHEWISPYLMKKPHELEKFSNKIKEQNGLPQITSLVPTQLQQLLRNAAGKRWLKSLSLIWIGGASITNTLANEARDSGILLAPCYGATETAAMITVLSPIDFLSGKNSAGYPLYDVKINVNEMQELKVKTNRLAIAKWNYKVLSSIKDSDAWWNAGDMAELKIINNKQELRIIGRKDNAINSGGEIIFPDILNKQLVSSSSKENLPIEEILILGVSNKRWGQSLIALIKLNSSIKGPEVKPVFQKLTTLTNHWQPAEKPIFWYNCPLLERNSNGKIEAEYWREWSKKQTPIL